MSRTSKSTTFTVHPKHPQIVNLSTHRGNALDSSEAKSRVPGAHLTISTQDQHVKVNFLY